MELTRLPIWLGIKNQLPTYIKSVLGLIILWQLSGLFWQVFSPNTAGKSLIPPKPLPTRQISTEAFLRWYGADTKDDSGGDLSLLAVIAGEHGAAVVKTSEGKTYAAKVGEDLLEGAKLVSVFEHKVQISRGGKTQEIAFPKEESTRLAQALPQEKNKAQSTALPPIRLTQGEMVSMLQGSNVSGWDKGISTATEGGIRVDRADTHPFAKLLKLKDGDVLKEINHRPLLQVADISLLSYHFGQQSAVDIEIVRRGRSFTQHYDIQP